MPSPRKAGLRTIHIKVVDEDEARARRLAGIEQLAISFGQLVSHTADLIGKADAPAHRPLGECRSAAPSALQASETPSGDPGSFALGDDARPPGCSHSANRPSTGP